MQNSHSLNYFSFIFFLFIILLTSPKSTYAIGFLDKTFGNGGIVTTDLGAGLSVSVHSLHRQSDGKIIVFGKVFSGSRFLLRYNPDGSLDTSFGNGGRIDTPFSSNDPKVSLTIQTDGLFAVGNNTRVIRYTSIGNIAEQVSFPISDVAGFGYDGKIATAYLIPAGGDCAFSTNQYKIVYNLFNRDGTFLSANQSCSGGSGLVGVVSLWGIVPSATNSFYLGYTHRALNTSSSFVREMVGNSINLDIAVDPGFQGFQLVDLAATENPGFVALGYYNLLRQRQGTQIYNFSFSLFPLFPFYQTAHAYQAVAALRISDSYMLVLKEDFSFAGFENTGRFFGGQQSGQKIYVQPDNKIIVAGYFPSATVSSKIRLIRYTSTFYNSLANKTDYDSDGKSDISIFRPSTGLWAILNSSDASYKFQQFGLSSDVIAPADYDGDGKTDISVFRPSNGTWYRLNSSDNSFSAIPLGMNGDLPVPADYDGDGKADIAVFRPSNGLWQRLNSSDGSLSAIGFGNSEDIPTTGNYDGDDKADIAVFRPSTGSWYRLNSVGGQFSAVQFGISEDKPTPADFDGDGKTDIAVFRPSNGTWYRLNSSNGSFTAVVFGKAEDKPVAADYGGDGKADIAVFRPSDGNWYLLRSTTEFAAVHFGVSEDRPTPNAFVR